MADPDELVRVRLLGELGEIEQPSVQWHVAQMLQHLRSILSHEQVQRGTELLQRSLARSTDWIVPNVTMDVLAEWAEHEPALAAWLTGELQRLGRDKRRSVAKRASKRLADLAE